MAESDIDFSEARYDILGLRWADCGCCYIVDSTGLQALAKKVLAAEHAARETERAATSTVQVALDKAVLIDKAASTTRDIRDEARYIVDNGYFGKSSEAVEDIVEALWWAANKIDAALGVDTTDDKGL